MVDKKNPCHFDDASWQDYKKGINPLPNRDPAEIPAYKKPRLASKQPTLKTDHFTQEVTQRGRPTRPQKTIDLHGQTEKTVFTTLERFVRQCIAENVKCVLVITGKGGAKEIGGFQLKEEVPRFLKSDMMRLWVISVVSAPQNLGGEGAWLVGLRAKNKVMRQK